MTGKEKCKLLRQIRQEIANSNGIVYITTECTYEGDDCLGTCPKCDQEIAYLDAELNRKIADGEFVTISGISLNTFNASIPASMPTNNGEDAPVVMGDFMPLDGDLSYPDHLAITIDELDFSVRTFNCLKRGNINTVADLIQKSPSDLMKVRNMGKKSLDEIIKRLDSMGLSLAEDPEEEEDDDVPIACGGFGVLGEDDDEEKLRMSIEDLDLSVRSFNCLKRDNIETVGDLINRSTEDLMKIRNMGKKSMDEIVLKVHSLGLLFLDETNPW